MQKSQRKHYIILLGILILIIILLFIITKASDINLFNLNKSTPQVKKNSRFTQAKISSDHTFSSDKQKFVATIGKMDSPSSQQQSISIYTIDGDNKKVVFERFFHADKFRGNTLSYTLSSESGSLTQEGSLGLIGCDSDKCSMPWSNFYIWDAKQNTFILDNTHHKDTFAQLLSTYQDLDKKGCSLISGKIIENQTDLTFTQLYKKYPKLSSYCNDTQAITQYTLTFFLKAEKAIQEILDGDNIASKNIESIPL